LPGKISQGLILEAALELIDREGTEGFSMRKLASRLKVEAMSLYHYYPSKGHLFNGVADHLVGQVAVPARGSWQIRLRQAMDNYRGVAHQHPRAYPLMAARRYNLPASLHFLEQLLAILAKAGFDPGGRARAFRMLGYFLHGALLAEISVRGQNAEPTPSVIDGQSPRLPHPHLRESAPFLGAEFLEPTYRAGQAMILEWLEQQLKG